MSCLCVGAQVNSQSVPLPRTEGSELPTNMLILVYTLSSLSTITVCSFIVTVSNIRNGEERTENLRTILRVGRQCLTLSKPKVRVKRLMREKFEEVVKLTS